MVISTEGIKIYDVRLIKPPSLSKRTPKFQIMIKCGSEERTSTKSAFSKRDLCVTWNGEAFVFFDKLTDDIILTFTIFRVRRFPWNIAISSCEHRAIDLLKMQNSSASGSCTLDVTGNRQLTFKIEKSLNVMSVRETAGNLPNREISAENANLIVSATQACNDNEDALSSFINKFQIFVGMVDDIAEINPYVKVAWSILSIIQKMTIATKNHYGDKIHPLCGKLNDVYDYITDAGRLPELTTTQSKTLSAVVRQTTECAYFIQAYSTEGTVKNVMKGISGSVDYKIQEFNDKFDGLMQAMRDMVNLETNIVTLRVPEHVGELADLTLLKDMHYNGTFPVPWKRCLPGTRKTLINDILRCISDDKSPQILVVSGQAGVGKSAIAHTIAEMFKEQNRLGSMFCFDRSLPNRRNCLFSTISRDLANGDASWRRELIKTVKRNTAIRETEDPKTQFNEFIIKPSKNVTTIGPVVIVVDALDENGDRAEREKILEILLRRWTELPKNYRLIVTTRPEQDIEAQSKRLNISCKRMGDIDAEETRSDIKAYVSKRLASISSILDNIDRNWRDVLAIRAEGLFHWAQTACAFIDTGVETPPELIKENWETYISNNSDMSLYELYHLIISSQSECRSPSFKEMFKIVVGGIITARVPLSIYTLQNIFSDDIQDIRSILSPFSSFFSGIHNSSEFTPVQPLHTSLFDFFRAEKFFERNQQNTEKLNEFYINTSNQSQMTLGCVKLMNRMLCFNICQLETSHRRNQDVPDLDSRVEKAIPVHLSYSCRFWTFHLQSSPVNVELIREVRRLMDDNLLYYFEVLSLLNAIPQGCVAMRELTKWCKDAVQDDLAEDAMDAQVFGIDFQSVMTTSTPHLYLSALPFTPRDSFVSRRYLERYPELFSLDVGQPVSSSHQIVFTQDNTRRIAFSPKGRYMATSTVDIFDVWDYETGERMFCSKDTRFPLACDVVFSPNGELVYCCFAGGDIVTWNITTREMVIQKYKEVADISIQRFNCSISSDGCFVAWHTTKETLLSDRESRRIVKRFETGCLFSAFSPNGKWIALYGHGVHIWDTRNQTQHCVMPCYPWGKPALTDNYVAFQKDKTTIEIWDVQKITKVTEIQHGKDITGLCLSSDDQYLLVISDSMISNWSVSTGKLLSRSYEDESIVIECLGFSHDSKLIALLYGSTLHVQEWERFIEQDRRLNNGIVEVHTAWLRGSYLILSDETRKHLQISDVTKTNTIIFQTGFKDCNVALSVSPDEENMRVAYFTSRGLCLWNSKEGEILVDRTVRLVTALTWLDNYLIFGDNRTIKIWDLCTRRMRSSRGPIDLSYESLLPVRGSTTRFAVIYDGKVEVRDCESGDGVGVTFPFHSSYPFDTVFVNEKHLVCTSENGVDIHDLKGARVSPIPFLCGVTQWRVSLNGKYMVWIDTGGNIQILDMDTQSLLTGPSFEDLSFVSRAHPIGSFQERSGDDEMAGCAEAKPRKLDRRVDNFWLSNDSKCIIILSSMDTLGSMFLDIWDIQSRVAKTVSYPLHLGSIKTLILGKGVMVAITREQCYVWDSDTLEIMSTLYNTPSPAADSSDIARIPPSTKSEILDYGLMAWKQGSLTCTSTVQTDGWCNSPRNEVMFWVPGRMRKRLWLPCMAHMPYQDCTKLNFTNFVHGSDWTKCKSGNN